VKFVLFAISASHKSKNGTKNPVFPDCISMTVRFPDQKGLKDNLAVRNIKRAVRNINRAATNIKRTVIDIDYSPFDFTVL
jgi:hypothetical protein